MPRNPKNQTQTRNTKKEVDVKVLDMVSDLQDIVNKCDTVINGLAPSIAWQTVVEDFKVERQRLDDNWQNISDDKVWAEAKITKMAVNKIISLVDDYKNDRTLALKEIDDLINEEKIAKDVDNA